MPLVYVGRRGEEPVTGAHEKARKVRPEYLGGKLVKVAWASNLAEAELLQGMLLDQGIPSSERRTRGFDVPDFLAGGPRDILVPEAAYETARELVSTTGDEPRTRNSPGRGYRSARPSPARRPDRLRARRRPRLDLLPARDLNRSS